MAYTLTCVLLSSLKPLFFNGLKQALTLLANSYKCPTRTIGGHNGVYWIYNRLPH